MEIIARKRLSWAGALVFIVYISLVLYFVFFSDHYGRVTGFTEFRYNLTPFSEIHRYLTYREAFTWENLITNLAGNILVFVPFGILVPIIRRKKTGIFYVFFLTLFFSLFIETVQLFTRVGVFDVDDLIMNTVGGVLGYSIIWIGKVYYRIQYRIRHGKVLNEAEVKVKKHKSDSPKAGGVRQPTAKTFRHSQSKYREVNGRKR